MIIDDGKKRKKYFLNRPHYGLYIPNLAWRELENFSTGSICLVLASEEYEESDYYRNYRKFKAALKAQRNGAVSRSAGRLPRTKK